MFKVDITKTVPRFILNDKNGYALAKAIEAGLQIANDTVEQGVRCVIDPDAMPEWRLDEMAWETNCLYDYGADIEVKRKWIKNAMPLYRIYGTPAAIKEVIRAMMGGGHLVEWFDFEEEPKIPGTFDVVADITEVRFAEDSVQKMLTMIEKSKNARSVMRGLKIHIKTEPDVAVGCLVKAYRKMSTTEIPGGLEGIG